MDIKKLVESMSVEELCGQVLSYDIQPGDTDEDTLETIEKILPVLLEHQKSLSSSMRSSKIRLSHKLHHQKQIL